MPPFISSFTSFFSPQFSLQAKDCPKWPNYWSLWNRSLAVVSFKYAWSSSFWAGSPRCAVVLHDETFDIFTFSALLQSLFAKSFSSLSMVFMSRGPFAVPCSDGWRKLFGVTWLQGCQAGYYALHYKSSRPWFTVAEAEEKRHRKLNGILWIPQRRAREFMKSKFGR